jgi:hypothetical protein
MQSGLFEGEKFMKKQMGFLILVAFAFTLFTSGASANDIGVNITVSDKVWDNSSNSWYNSSKEDQEVEPNMIYSQVWDLEGVFLKGNELSLVGGFDFNDGVASGGHTFTGGDLFIGPNPGVNYGNAGTVPSIPPMNIYGYEWAIRLNFTTNEYYVYSIDNTSLVELVYYETHTPLYNRASNPWRLVTTGLTPYKTGSFDYIEGLSNQLIGNSLTGGTHNLVEGIDLGLFMQSGKNFTVHYTMECGNDNLIGQGTTVPEPGTLILLGSGLVAAAALRRKVRK